MERLKKSPEKLAEEASSTEMSFEELEACVLDTITLASSEETNVITCLTRALVDNGQTRVLVFAIVRVDAPCVFWEASVREVSALEQFRASFETYALQGEPERLELDDFLGAIAGGSKPALDADTRLLSGLVNYLQEIHYSFSMYKQRAVATRDPTQIDPGSALARVGSFFGQRVHYELTEYSVVTDLTLTRYKNKQVQSKAAAARLLAMLHTPRDEVERLTASASVTAATTLSHWGSHGSDSGSGARVRPRPTTDELHTIESSRGGGNTLGDSLDLERIDPVKKKDAVTAGSGSSSSGSSSSSDDVVLSQSGSETIPTTPPAKTLATSTSASLSSTSSRSANKTPMIRVNVKAVAKETKQSRKVRKAGF
jgi:hypothetical protein